MRQLTICRFVLVVALLAAAFSAGMAQAAEIILYDNRNFGGQSVTLTQSTPDLGNFDNEASSVRVISGAWILYRNDNYGVTPTRPSVTLTPGDYPNLSDAGFPRNRLSSVRLITDDVAQPPPVNCPPPYRVQGAGGQCNWSCAPGTRPGPGGQCVCQSGLVETGTDNQGRRVCGPGQVAPPPAAQPGTRQPPGGMTQSCTGPYRRSSIRNGQPVCLWTCGPRSHPDAARGECVCDQGAFESGVDQRGRRLCSGRERNVQPVLPRTQRYVANGAVAVGVAQSRGFLFIAEKVGPLLASCTVSGPSATAIYGLGGISRTFFPAECIVTFFGGRALATGWRLVDVRLAGPNVSLSSDRARMPPVRWRFTANRPGETVSSRLVSITLEGPPGRDWREAFRR